LCGITVSNLSIGDSLNRKLSAFKKSMQCCGILVG
jgi:hypothetical protein